MPKNLAAVSFSRILETLRRLSAMAPAKAKERHPTFPNFATHVAKLFHDDRLFDIIPRLELEMRLIDEHKPPLRPALDPYVSTQIGVFSKNFSDWEIGHFLSYPDCCIRPFAEETRYGLDERHSKELQGEAGMIFATTAGFIPHSIYCKESHKRALIAFINQEELQGLKKLESEIFTALPHMHPEYRGQYYEIRAP
jgi:hypothetical protein